MNAIRIHTQIGKSNELILHNLPMSAGKKVEVIILEDNSTGDLSHKDRFPLRDKSIRYESPFDPAIDATDWDAIQ